MSEYKFWIHKDQTSFAFYPQFSAIDFDMSATAKSTTPLSPPWLSPRTGPEYQHQSSSLVVRMRCLSSMLRQRRGANASRLRGRRSNIGKRQRGECTKRQRRELARRWSGKRERRWGTRHVSRQRRTGQRCSGGLQRSLVQEVSKKRAREESEAGPNGDRSDDVR